MSIGLGHALVAQTFVHPGGLHTLADLNRMKTNVLAGNHPWIDDWNVLINDAQAQSNYTTHATSDFNANRQNADADAHAAYLNTIRWYISGDANFANTATNILNKWSSAVTTNTETGGGLSGLPTMSFALAGELLRTYNGWKAADFSSFTNMMLKYLYPPCNNWVTGQNQSSRFQHWTSWDAPNNAAIMTIGVLCDDINKYNQAVNFFKNGLGAKGVGTGAISNAIPFLYSGGIGQCDESGRDQEHCTLGIADMGVACQVAWNQGLDLYGFANNRLLAGIEYVAKYNLSHDVPYTSFNESADNASGDNLFYISDNGRGRIDDRPVYEMFYNHYVVLQGLSAPNIKAMAQLYRPDQGSPDHFGYQTLTFTLSASASPYPAAPAPLVPTGLTAQAGISQVILNWTPAAQDLARGYTVWRSTTSGGPYTSIASWTANTFPNYTDNSAVNGTTYYYVVSANNQSGTSANSAEISATPGTSALPAGWTAQDIGVVTNTGSTGYAGGGNNTFILACLGTGIGSTGDNGFHYTYLNVTNNFTIVARLMSNNADQMGLMMRASLATNAALVQFFMADLARKSIFGTRTGTGANLNHSDSGDQFTYLPAWYKLTRAGNTFTAYQSSDGVTWTAVGSSSAVTMGANYYAGLAINNGNAIFDNVVYTNAAVTGSFAPPATPTNVAVTALASNQVYVSWASVTNASGYNIRRSTVSGNGYIGIASNVTAVAYYDTTVTANSNYYYVVSAINGGGESTNSIESSVATSGALAPAAPASLTATPGVSLISLNWTASIGASSYNVYRSTTDGGSYANIATGVIATFSDTNVVANIRYYYVVTAINDSGESDISPQANAALLVKLMGAIIGTPGSFGSLGNTIANVFDGNLTTFFDGPDSSGDWAGRDFGVGVSNVIGAVQYCPRATFASRMVGGVFQGANNPSFTSPVTLFTVTATPAYSVMNSQAISITNAFRYVRYRGPNNANCNVAEIEFDGSVALPAPPLAPSGLTASLGDGQVALSWNASTGATGYNVKSSTTNGGSYNIIATNVVGLVYTNTGLNNGTTYYYVVSAVNAGGEGTNSAQASGTPVSLVQPQLAFAVNGNHIRFNWPSDHLGWTLQVQTNSLTTGLGTNWVSVPNSNATNQISIPIGSTDGSVFFRLTHP